MPRCTAPSAPAVTASRWSVKTRAPPRVWSKRSRRDPRPRVRGEALVPAQDDERTSPARRPDPPVPAGGGGRPRSAGVATAYGEVEGGGAALLAAAEDALREAAPGQVVRSRTLEGRPRILVVDDDLSFAQVLAESISERGWDAHPCSEPADARQRVRDRSYSGLFIDMVLPGTSGAEILREALAAHPRRPAILMSGHDANHEAILEALTLGPVMFVHKPMSSADLDSALQMFRELVPGMVRRRRGTS